MAVVTPVAQNGVAPSQAMTPGAPGGNTVTAEQTLLDYVARFQAEGLASRQGLANPAALSGEALKALKGYFDRATDLQDSAVRKAQMMSENGSDLVPRSEGEVSTLPGGPARENLEPAAAQIEASADKVSGISNAELDQTIEALMTVLHYGMETSLIASASHNISRSGNTLLRGQ